MSSHRLPAVVDLMTRSPVIVRADAEVHELEKLFLEHRIHGAPVVDAGGRLVGVVSQTDLLAWHFETGHDGLGFYEPVDLQHGELRRLSLSDIRTARVGEIMTPLVHAIRPEETASEAAARMIRHRIHRLVVVDGALRVLGVVSAMDLLRLVPGTDRLL
jgi:CBS domain-containing protein